MIKLLDRLFRGHSADVEASFYSAGFKAGSRAGYDDGYRDGLQARQKRGHIRREQKALPDPQRAETLYGGPRGGGRYREMRKFNTDPDVAVQSAAAYGDPWTKD